MTAYDKLGKQFGHPAPPGRKLHIVTHATSIYGRPSTSYLHTRGQSGIATNPGSPDLRLSHTRAQHRPYRHGHH